MTKTPPTIEELHCGCGPDDPWPPPSIGPAPPPKPAHAPPDATVPPQRYDLRGPQVEPAAAFWTLCGVSCVIRIADLVKRTDELGDPCYFPPYPTESSVVRDELDELVELASLRDDPEAVAGNRPRRERRGISPFLQLRPQPITAVANVEYDPRPWPCARGTAARARRDRHRSGEDH